jgi:hypothetical protein
MLYLLMHRRSNETLKTHLLTSIRVVREILCVCVTLGSTGTQLIGKSNQKKYIKRKSHKAVISHASVIAQGAVVRAMSAFCGEKPELGLCRNRTPFTRDH